MINSIERLSVVIDNARSNSYNLNHGIKRVKRNDQVLGHKEH